MNDQQLLRYSRHILLDEVGIEGQERLRAAHALIVGAGGLGCPAALYLAASGIETLIHYPVAIPRQPALAAQSPAECPVAVRMCGEILSLPLHPALRDDEVDEIAAAVHAFQPRTVVS